MLCLKVFTAFSKRNIYFFLFLSFFFQIDKSQTFILRNGCWLAAATTYLEPISTTFYEHNCANFIAPIKSLTFTSSTKKLRAKLSYKKAACKMLVKLTPIICRGDFSLSKFE